MPEPALIALTGPTAAGKTAAALAVAERWPVEIISVDSALVYQGMDLGTAKPSAQELASAVHHLIDIRDPSQPYSAAEFQRDALRLIDDIRSRGRHPLLVGGTMLYLKALMHGLDDMPTAEPSVRAEIAAEAAALGWPALHAELAKVDPLTAERLPPQDAQRIARALEVWRVSGRTLSSFHQQKDRHQGVEMSLIALEPQQRSWLHERIAIRFDQMLSQGLMQEVWDLMQRGDLHPQLPSMRCVGYRQCWQALQSASAGTAPSSVAPALSPAQLALLRSQGIAATRQLAKRQITWLRSMPQRHTVACDAPDALRQTLQRVQVLWGCT